MYKENDKYYVVEDELVSEHLSGLSLEDLGRFDIDALIREAFDSAGIPVWRCERVRSMPDFIKDRFDA